MARERRHGVDRRHAGELPQQLAREVVRAHALGAGRHDLGAPIVLPHEWRRPVRAFGFAVGAPQLLAGARVERRDKRSLFIVVDDVEAAVVEDGRRGRAPAGAHLDRGHRLRPRRLAAHVEREQSGVTEIDVDPLAVGDRRFRGVRILLVHRLQRHRGVHGALPIDLAGVEIDVVEHPAMFIDRLADIAARHRAAERSREIGADGVQRRHRLLDVDRGDHEHVVAPHDRRAPAAARHVDLPGNVLRRAPRVR